MNAILFATAFAGVLAAVAASGPTSPSGEHDNALSVVPGAYDEPFMARGELHHPDLGGWSVNLIGSAE